VSEVNVDYEMQGGMGRELFNVVLTIPWRVGIHIATTSLAWLTENLSLLNVQNTFVCC
jgi:hypothetical protein